MKNTAIRVESLYKTFHNGEVMVPILKGISLEFLQGQTYAITGVSGCGKSTFMYLLAGLDCPTQGTIFWDGRSTAQLNETEFSSMLNSFLGVVFQSSFLLKELTVLENVMIKGLMRGLSYQQCEEKAFNLLKSIDLAGAAYKKPTQLSGGQQQRVAVMRALFNEPAFLLADEPTGNLDKKSSQDLIHFLLDCQAQWNMGMIISTHDQFLASTLDHTLILHDGFFLPAGNQIVHQAHKELS